MGKNLSVSPAYTFYDSKETGCRYIENAALIRIYAGLKIRRRSQTFIIFETSHGLIKIRGRTDFFKLRKTYDALYPKVLIGEKGRELDAERLQLIVKKRRQGLFIIAVSLLCWSQLAGFCLRQTTWQSLALMAAATAAQIVTAVFVLRMIQKYDP